MSVSLGLLLKMLLLVLVMIFDQMGVLPEISVRAGDYWEQPRSILTQVDTKIRTEKGFLYYGQLVLELPNGVSAKVQESEQAGDVIDLRGAGNGVLAPRIWIAHYRSGDSNEWAMASALLDLLPDITLRLRHRDAETGTNLFTYTCGYKNGYILTYGNDIYIVEEMSDESACGFGKMLDNRDVCWADGGREGGDQLDDSYAVWFDKLTVGEDSFLAFCYTAQDGKRWLNLMKDGDYSHVYQKIKVETPASDEQLICKDYNFDGYTDIKFSSQGLYLWKPGKKCYEKADVPEEFMQLQSEAVFSETEVIWGYQSVYGDEENQNDIDETETLWQWTGIQDTLVKRRECRAQIRGKTVRIQGQDSIGYPNAEFNQTFMLEEYQQGSAEVRALYENFYDKMAPAETYTRFHVMEYGMSHMRYVPQGLLNQTMDALLRGVSSWELVPQRTGEWLSEKEILEIAKDNPDLRHAVARGLTEDPYTVVMVDGDNDGILDIIAQEDSESSIGNDGLKDYVFYQGQGNGIYLKTDVYSSAQEGFSNINYEGKNYLRCASYNCAKGRYDGISIICFEDGGIVEQADLILTPDSYEFALAQYTQKEYRPYAEQLAADALTYKAVFDEYGKVVGSGEKVLSGDEDYRYQCDLNNDGVAERYKKELLHSDSTNICEYVHFDGEGTGIEVVNEALYSLDHTPVMIWAEDYQGENIVNMMVLTGLEDFEITSFLITGSAYEKICGVCAEADYGVSVSGRG